MKRKSTLLVLCLLAVPIHVGSQADGTGSDVEWWGPTEEPDGFHIRVPVTVRNDFDDPIQNGLVMAQVDLTSGLVQAGWIHEASGTKERLSAFELDPNSIRVVEMRDLDPTKPGTRNGTLLAYDSTIPGDDPRRYEVPSTYVEGFLHGDGGGAFNHKTNPRLTVQWVVQEEMVSGEERHFVIYLDSRTNGQHQAADYQSTPATPGSHLLENAFWSGPGTELIGHVVPDGRAGNVVILGIHDDTSVEVQTATKEGSFIRAPPASHGNPLTIDEDQSVRLFISNEPTTFRLLADKPVLAVVDSEGFIPSTNGDFTGDDFLFATTYPQKFLQDSLYILNRNPTDAPTTVQLQPLDAAGQPDGPSRCITLSYSSSTQCTPDGKSNHLPYTMGRRASTQDGTCQFFANPWNLGINPAPMTYRATVIEGGPVTIQYDAVQGISQVPALDEGPLGKEFWSVLARTNYPQEPQSCSQSDTEAYQIFSASPHSTSIEIASLERTNRLFPSQGQEERFGPLPGGDVLQGLTVNVLDQTDRPLQLNTDEPSWLMVGRTDKDALRDVPLRGPLGGGNAGREFAGFNDAILYAPYAGTRVEMSLPHSEEPIRFDLAKERAMLISQASGTNVRGQWYTLDADRPLVVLPAGASSGFLGGVPPTLTATVHLESTAYKGYLVDIASPSGFDPMLVTTTPDEPAEYTLLVTNRGRGVGGGDLTDDIKVCPQDVPTGWTTHLDGATGCTTLTNVKSGETRSVRFQVEAPSDIPARAKAFIPVQASSANNANVFDTIGTVTQVRSTFDVGLWFDVVQGNTEQSKVLFTNNDTAEYTLKVRNLGSVENHITLSFNTPGATTNQEGTWVVLMDGQEEVELTLPPQGTAGNADTATVPLQITPPDDITEGTLTTFITARSFIGSASSSVAALTTLQGKSDLVLTPGNTLDWIDPGDEAVFRFTLENKGDGSTPVFFDVQDDEPPGWTKPKVYVPTPQGGRALIEEFVILPGEKRDLLVTVQAPEDALADDSDSIRFHISTNTPGEEQEHFLKAIVKPTHDIQTAIVGKLPIQVDEHSSQVPVTIRLTNDGNLDEILQATVASVPPDWNVTLPADELVLLRNTTDPSGTPTQSMEIRLGLPPGISKGEYTVAIRLTSEDRHATLVHIPVNVGAFADFTTESPERVQAQPGKPVKVPVTITNTGNDAITFTATEAAGETWTMPSTASIRLPAGATTTLPVTWTVPTKTPDGTTTHRFEFMAISDDPSVGTLRRIIDTQVDVGRVDLSIAGAQRFEGAAGYIVTATLQNTGSRTAHDVQVHLVVGSETVDELTLGQMVPGRTYDATFLQPLGSQGAVTLVIDPEDRIVEVDETNNVYAIDEDGESKDTPTLSVPAILFAFALLAIGYRSRKGP